MNSIAKRLHVRRATLIAARDRATAQGTPWVVQPSVQLSAQEARIVRERTTAQAIDLASQRLVAEAEADGTLDDIASVLRQQVPLAAKLTRLVVKLVDDALAERIGPGPKSDAASFVGGVASAVAKAQEIVRVAGGVKPGEPSTPEAADVAVTELEIRKNVVRAPLDKKIDTLKFCIVDVDGKPYNYDHEEDENK
jgi:hypothetical protein